jgi:glutamate 5-kinase
MIKKQFASVPHLVLGSASLQGEARMKNTEAQLQALSLAWIEAKTEERNANAKATLDTLLQLGVVPIINENDTVVTDEIKFGDNDNLAALVANLIHADLLVILTDQGGLYTADPRQNPDATLLIEASAGDPALEKMAGGAGSELSKGGMLTKVLAAKLARQTGTTTVIASGHEPNVLTRLLAGEIIGTRLKPS